MKISLTMYTHTTDTVNLIEFVRINSSDCLYKILFSKSYNWTVSVKDQDITWADQPVQTVVVDIPAITDADKILVAIENKSAIVAYD